MDALSVVRCSGQWISPRSGQPLYCAREPGHVGECRDGAGYWRDEDERNSAKVNARVRATLENEGKEP